MVINLTLCQLPHRNQYITQMWKQNDPPRKTASFAKGVNWFELRLSSQSHRHPYRRHRQQVRRLLVLVYQPRYTQ